MHSDSDTVLVTCSGISNTGKLTTKVSEALHRKCPGIIECSLAARSDPEKLRDVLIHVKRIVVVDGCTDCCGRKNCRSMDMIRIFISLPLSVGSSRTG